MANTYSNEERVWIIKNFYNGNSYRHVRDSFAVFFEERPIPSVTTIRKLVNQFETTASAAVRSNVGNNNGMIDVKMLEYCLMLTIFRSS